MKKALSLLAVLTLVLTFSLSAVAEEPKEVTLKGSICCAKCELKKEAACWTAIVTKKDGKETVYYFDKASPNYKENHKVICTEAKPGTVKGTVTKVGDKMIIKTSDVKFD